MMYLNRVWFKRQNLSIHVKVPSCGQNLVLINHVRKVRNVRNKNIQLENKNIQLLVSETPQKRF